MAKTIRIDINGIIGEDWWDPELSNTVKTVMAAADGAQAGDTLEVHVNSGGGSFFEGLAIMNTLSQYKAKGVIVETWVDGLAASAASLIILAGSRRVVARSAMVMIHNVWTWAAGDANEMEKAAATLRQFNGLAAGAYADHTNETVESALALMDAETWMDGAQCLERGFATETSAVANDDEADEAVQARVAGLTLPQGCTVPQRFAASVRKDRFVIADMAAGFPAPRARDRQATPQAQTQSDAVPAAAASSTTPNGEQATNKETSMSKDNPAGGTSPEADTQAAAAAAAKAERARANAINKLLDMTNAAQHLSAEVLAKVKAECLGDDDQDGLSVIDAQNKIFAAIEQAKAASPDQRRSMPAEITADGRDKFIAGVTNAVLAQQGIEARDGKNEFNGINMHGVVRACLAMNGVNSVTMTPSQLATSILNQHATPDFPLLLENIATKTVLKGYEEAEEVFDKLARAGTVTDYKEVKRVATSMFPSLEKVEEGAEYTEGTIGERGAALRVAKYGRIIDITEEMIVNDDTASFSRVPRLMGQAAKRTIGNLFWAILTANPTFNGAALFSSGRKNLLSGGGSALADAGLTAADVAFGTRTDLDTAGGVAGDAVVNVSAKYLVVPKALDHTAKRLMQQETVNGTGGTLGGTPNTHRGRYEVLTDARLDRAVGGSTRWFLMADPNLYDTIEIAYLDGQQAPAVTRHEDYKKDAIRFKVKIVAGVAPLDFFCMQRNEGA